MNIPVQKSLEQTCQQCSRTWYRQSTCQMMTPPPLALNAVWIRRLMHLFPLGISVRFLVDDVEDPEWLNGSNWDLIHLRFVVGTLRNIPETLTRCFECVPPIRYISPFTPFSFYLLIITPTRGEGEADKFLSVAADTQNRAAGSRYKTRTWFQNATTGP